MDLLAGISAYGRMTMEQARAKWLEMAAAPDCITDFDNPQKEKQIRVGTKKIVDYRDTHTLPARASPRIRWRRGHPRSRPRSSRMTSPGT